MRNFIVAFMLVILLSSIMFVILRPIQPTQVNNDKKEKSNVEKLLTEPSQTPQNSYHEMSSADKKEIIDDNNLKQGLLSKTSVRIAVNGGIINVATIYFI